MKTQKKIALVAPNWLGDAVMSLPLVGMLAAVEAVSLAVVAPEATARTYAGLDGIDELVTLPKRGPSRGIASRRKYLRRVRPDAAVLLPPSLSSAVAPWLARVPVRVGYRADGRGPILTDAVSLDGSRNEHLTRNYLRLGEQALRRVGLEKPESYATPSVRVTSEDRDRFARLAESRNVPRKYAVVVPGATYGPAKSWPWQRYRTVAHELSKSVTVLLAGASGERGMCARIVEGAPRGLVNMAGETTLGEFLALLSGAAVVVANDSGSPHLAASLGTPVVVLFGSTSPVWTSPQGPSVDVVRHPVVCSPCFRKTCPTQLECFDGISTEDVLAATRKYL
jgi:heptosyltransferase-2